MMRADYSNTTMKSIPDSDMLLLNNIPDVQFKPANHHKNFSINELILEMSHFLDEEVVNKKELQLMSDRLRSEWNLPEEF